MYQLKCIVCEKDFEGKIPHKKTCSDECRKLMSKNYHKDLYYKDKEEHNRLCEHCRKQIEGAKQKRFCDLKCKKQAEYLRLNPLINIKCVFCNQTFQARKKESQYCSQSCYNKHTKSHSNVLLKCEECNNDFEISYIHRNHRFCSKSCSTTWMNKNVMTEESYRKISETQKRQFATGERKHSWIGRKHTEITREKISVSASERIINGEKNAYVYSKKGKHFSIKLNREIHFRSSYEEIAFKFLDKDNNVLTYLNEPFFIEYFFENATHRYIPDILITYKTGIQKLIEIKPEWRLIEPKIIAKHNTAKSYCQEKGLIFEVWTEKDIENLFNT